MPEKKEEEKVSTNDLNTAILQKVLDTVATPDVIQKYENLLAKHESNYRISKDKYALLSLSQEALSLIDVTTGYRDIITNPAEFTQQGLRIYDRYLVKIKMLPDDGVVYKWSLIDIKDYQEPVSSFGISNDLSIASMRQRMVE